MISTHALWRRRNLALSAKADERSLQAVLDAGAAFGSALSTSGPRVCGTVLLHREHPTHPDVDKVLAELAPSVAETVWTTRQKLRYTVILAMASGHRSPMERMKPSADDELVYLAALQAEGVGNELAQRLAAGLLDPVDLCKAATAMFKAAASIPDRDTRHRIWSNILATTDLL